MDLFHFLKKTDVYSFALILWELITNDDPFPNISDGKELCSHVMNGKRPTIKKYWPTTFKEFLSQLWSNDSKNRPLFPTIIKKYDSVTLELLCPDPIGIDIVNRFWKGKRRDKTISYSTFWVAFCKELQVEFVKTNYAKYFQSIICDPYNDTVTFESFTRVITLFGPLDPVDQFFINIKSLLSRTFFHGHLTEEKSETLVKNMNDFKNVVFLYRYSSDMRNLILTFVNQKEDDKVQHIEISRDQKGTYRDENSQIEYESFKELHRDLKKTFKLRIPVQRELLLSTLSLSKNNPFYVY